MANKLAPIVILVALVLGGIYGGYFTPTEAGAAGALGALLISLAKRRLTWASFWQVLGTKKRKMRATIRGTATVRRMRVPSVISHSG